MLKRLFTFLLVIVLLALVSIYYPPQEALSGKIVSSYTREQAILSRVIDGDTIELDNGEHVRLLGINTPEKNMPYANNASYFLKQFVNKTIILERDREDIDKYKRKLRYIFYEDRFLNLEILENGFANAYYYSGLKYEKEIIRAENQAQVLELGIWTKSSEECSIDGCIYLKDLNYTEEYFIISNKCSFDCNLSGWFVKDLGRNTFYLDYLSSGYDKRYDSPNGKEIWNNEGDRLLVFDRKGELVLIYDY